MAIAAVSGLMEPCSFYGPMVYDLSPVPVELVAERETEIWLTLNAGVYHPDLWHNGRWEEK